MVPANVRGPWVPKAGIASKLAGRRTLTPKLIANFYEHEGVVAVGL
jgi:hypothetical protein